MSLLALFASICYFPHVSYFSIRSQKHIITLGQCLLFYFPDKIILLKNRPYFTQNALQRQIGLQVVNGQINSTLIFSSILRQSEFGCWENLRLKKDILVFQDCILLEKDWTKLKNLHVFVNWTSSVTQQKTKGVVKFQILEIKILTILEITKRV